jgi:hypothetical protein
VPGEFRMPGLDGTGPQVSGPMKGRGPGRCRIIAVPAHVPAVPVQQANDERGTALPEESGQNIRINGCGRGRTPCECGHGFGFGGKRRCR